MTSRFKLRRLRSVHVIIATIALLAPASALAASGLATVPGQAASHSITLHITTRHLRFGRRATATGSAPAADAGKRLVLEGAPAGTSAWSRVGSGHIDRRGRFRVRFVPRRSGLIRAVAATPAAAPVASAAALPATGTPPAGDTSPAHPVRVAARFAVARRRFAVLGRGAVRVAGDLMPAAPGRVVRLQGRSGRHWRTVAHARTGPRGRFAVRYRPGAATDRRLRVLFPGDSANARATDPAGTVSVFQPTVASWYDDAGTTACGFHAGLGVANKSLPCGAHVAFHYGHRTVVATVDDRGPYVGGRSYDLNQNTAGALGFAGVGRVWASS